MRRLMTALMAGYLFGASFAPAIGARADDGWLSVAESLEFLPGGPMAARDFTVRFPDGWSVREATPEEPPGLAQSPSSGPAAVAQRVEVPEAGVALTIPEDWGFRVDMRETDWAATAVGTSVDATIWQVLDSWTPAGDPEAAVEHCSVGLLRVGEQSAETMTFGGVIDDPGLEADQSAPGWKHTSVEILLPAGLVTRNDEVGREPDGDWYSTTYNFVAPDGMAWLACSGPERPGDRWLSVAETFEFLSAEE